MTAFFYALCHSCTILGGIVELIDGSVESIPSKSDFLFTSQAVLNSMHLLTLNRLNVYEFISKAHGILPGTTILVI